jgi:hypothetical protein
MVDTADLERRTGTAAAPATARAAVAGPAAAGGGALRRALLGTPYEQQAALLRPQAGGGGLRSPRFRGDPVFEAVAGGQRLLRRGSCDGAPTTDVQEALQHVGQQPGPVDGRWGPKTDGAVTGFQRHAGVAADGVIGPVTLGALDEADAGRAGPAGGGPAQSAADPALKHNAGGSDSDPTDPERSAAGQLTRLPYEGVDAGSGWDGPRILRNWTQVDVDPLTNTDVHRCAANAAMASRILAGPAALGAYAQHVMSTSLRVIAHTTDVALKAQMSAKVAACGVAEAQLRLASATYHSLDLIADAVKFLFTNEPLGGTTGAEGQTLNGVRATERDANLRNRVPFDETGVNQLCNGLRPGEAWLVQVDTDKGTSSPSEDDIDHFVTVGCLRDKRPEDGGVYLYDPWPRQGSQLVLKDGAPDDFWAYFRSFDAGGRQWKYSEWLSRTEPAA